MLLKINEKKRWIDPVPTNPQQLAKQDQEIFQTAKLINCGHFMSIIMHDYVAGFLGLAEGNAWSMNAFDPIKLKNDKIIMRGEGNHVSVEFNILYRWHTTISAADEEWTKQVFHRAFNGIPPEQLTLKDFGSSLLKIIEDINPDPRQRTFAG
jgi:hypothetical protein